MKYSFVICYRDRESQLKILTKTLKDGLTELGIDHEIIVAEQDDTKIFRRGNLRNEGARVATGDILVLHDVDYVPTDVSVYKNAENFDIYLPVTTATFVNHQLEPMRVEDIPRGYRHFSTKVDMDFFGGVLCFKKDAFWKINGFSTLFKGWGFEDADLRRRTEHYGFRSRRAPEGKFYALWHPDSAPDHNDFDFQRNIALYSHYKEYLQYGLQQDHLPTVREVPPEIDTVDKWLHCTEFDAPLAGSHAIAVSNLQFDEEDLFI